MMARKQQEEMALEQKRLASLDEQDLKEVEDFDAEFLAMLQESTTQAK